MGFYRYRLLFREVSVVCLDTPPSYISHHTLHDNHNRVGGGIMMLMEATSERERETEPLYYIGRCSAYLVGLLCMSCMIVDVFSSFLSFE